MSTKKPVDVIFPDLNRAEAQQKRVCVRPPFGCGGPAEVFNDPISFREYGISGMCQKCQDKVFGTQESENDQQGDEDPIRYDRED